MAIPAIDTILSSLVDKVRTSGLLESLVVSGQVTSVGTDGTVTVARGLDSYPKVRCLSGYLSPTVGDNVTIVRGVSGWVCPGSWRVDSAPSGGGGSSLPSTVSSWTPTLTNVSVGNGQLTGWTYTVGKMQFAGAKLSVGSTTSISGEILVTPPSTPRDLPGAQLYSDVLGMWQYRAGGSLNYGGPASRYNSAGDRIVFRGCWDGSAPLSGVGKTNSPPTVGGTDHIFTFSLQYPTA